MHTVTQGIDQQWLTEEIRRLRLDLKDRDKTIEDLKAREAFFEKVLAECQRKIDDLEKVRK